MVEVETPNYVVVKRALVSLKIAKPDELTEQQFEELTDKLYVQLSEVVDARGIHAVLKVVLRDNGIDDWATAVEVL